MTRLWTGQRGSRAGIFLFTNDSGAHPRVKQSGHEADHTVLSSVKLKVWSYKFTSP